MFYRCSPHVFHALNMCWGCFILCFLLPAPYVYMLHQLMPHVVLEVLCFPYWLYSVLEETKYTSVRIENDGLSFLRIFSFIVYFLFDLFLCSLFLDSGVRVRVMIGHTVTHISHNWWLSHSNSHKSWDMRERGRRF